MLRAGLFWVVLLLALQVNDSFVAKWPGSGLVAKKDVPPQPAASLTARQWLETSHADGAHPAPDSSPRHPCWQFAWSAVMSPQAHKCCACLLFAGMLCSAGGIGGGAIFVMLLLVVGGLELSDAIPLSKAIIFVGSFSSMPLTLRRALAAERCLVDFNICRLVVPAALIGTYVGVLLNRIALDWMILLVLATVLIGMSMMVVRTTYRQYRQECDELATRTSQLASKECKECAERAAEAAGEPAKDRRCNGDARSSDHGKPQPETQQVRSRKNGLQHVMLPQDAWAAGAMMMTVIGFGVLRVHAGACQRATPAMRAEVCHHPSLFFLGDALEVWMHPNSRSAEYITSLAFAAPFSVCLSVLAFYSRWLAEHEEWQWKAITQYSAMAIFAGCLAGLVGIGGGLIFAPFFLLMGVEPSTTVATSSLCVMFTSASTALQFLLTDRIIMSLLFLYGSVTMVAFNLGTWFIQLLRDNFSARRSYISAVVTLGVVLSMVMSALKLLSQFKEGSKAVAE